MKEKQNIIDIKIIIVLLNVKTSIEVYFMLEKMLLCMEKKE